MRPRRGWRSALRRDVARRADGRLVAAGPHERRVRQLRGQRRRPQARPQEAVGAYGVIEPLSPVDPDGVVAIGGMVEKPDPAGAPSDLIIIGRYVLTPDVFDEIATLKPGAIGEIQLTDALRAQAARSPFHGVISEIERFDTGTPLGYLQAAISITMRRPDFGAELAEFVAGLDQRAPVRAGGSLVGGSAEALDLVDDETELVDVELADGAGRQAPCGGTSVGEAFVADRLPARRQGLDVDVDDVDRRPPRRRPTARRRIGTVAVNGVQASSMSAHPSSSVRYDPLISPPPVLGVDRQPQVGIVEVAEQQELADVPRRRQAQHVLDALAADPADRGPRLVVPRQASRLGVVAVPRRPRAPGRRRERLEAWLGTRTSSPVYRLRSSGVRRYGEAVISLADAQRVVVVALPAAGARRGRGSRSGRSRPGRRCRRRGRAAIRQQRRRRLRGRRRRHVGRTGRARGGRRAGGWCAAAATSLSAGPDDPHHDRSADAAGADAVVMVEDSELLDREKVRLRSAVGPAGTSVRAAGDDVARRRRVPGRHGRHSGGARRAGQHQCPNGTAYPAVRVAVMSTGDELVTDGSPLGPGRSARQPDDAGAAAAAAGCAVRTFGVVPDDEATLERRCARPPASATRS